MTRAPMSNKVARLARDAGKVIAGWPPEVQGAVVATLAATVLAGLAGPGEAEVREPLIEAHIRLVRALIPVMHKERLKPRMN